VVALALRLHTEEVGARLRRKICSEEEEEPL